MLSWNEIRSRAAEFSREWKDIESEAGEYQSFWDHFFKVFGTKRRSVARYQELVRLQIPSRHHGFIDLFWPGTLIVEHKSTGEDLESAYKQAGSYFDALPEENKPAYIIVTDYKRICLYDLEAEGGVQKHEFSLSEFSKHVHLFAFIAGRPAHVYKEEDPVNKKAVKLIVNLYSALRSGHYKKEDLSRLLVRLVFCFFADDTGIFEKDSFSFYIRAMTGEDGSNFGSTLAEIFQILNTDIPQRPPNINADLAALPYVNGGLFAESITLPFFDASMREAVLRAAEFDWSAVSPAIFGSMFQYVMDEDQGTARHDFGAHYTSERNILKVISALFLDDLYSEFGAAGSNVQKLQALREKLATISLLDPACGCGNFLVVAYRELRKLELEILKKLYQKEIEAGQASLPLEVKGLSKISVENMYGIELLSFPAEIARLSLWLVDHLSNLELGDSFGKPYSKLPLIEKPHILCDNALTADWQTLVPKEKLSYILGNPPFLGSKIMSDEQREEINSIFGKEGGGVLDYVSGWYLKSAQYIQSTNIRCAFVSTNSITQGEQVGILWREMIENYGIKIQFAHQTFKWTNEAPGRAAVYCVIVGFGLQDAEQAYLYEYEDIRGEAQVALAEHINPYLVDAPDIFISARNKPLSNVPEIRFGNQPIDGGLLTKFSAEEKIKFLQEEPSAEKYFRRFIGSEEFINGRERWCLWLKDADPSELRSMPRLMRQINLVREFRLLSKRADTRKLADTPSLFAFVSHPNSDYILIPSVSSENRRYVPMGFMSKEVVASNLCLIIPNATRYHFGILESEMHMAWMRAVAGRLKSDYRYSNSIVYNNFPWPENLNEEQKEGIEEAAKVILDVRAKYSDSVLADLYDPNTMPQDLLSAHRALDKAVDAAYGKRSFKSEPERLEFLFGLYQELIKKT